MIFLSYGGPHCDLQELHADVSRWKLGLGYLIFILKTKILLRTTVQTLKEISLARKACLRILKEAYNVFGWCVQCLRTALGLAT